MNRFKMKLAAAALSVAMVVGAGVSSADANILQALNFFRGGVTTLVNNVPAITQAYQQNPVQTKLQVGSFVLQLKLNTILIALQ